MKSAGTDLFATDLDVFALEALHENYLTTEGCVQNHIMVSNDESERNTIWNLGLVISMQSLLPLWIALGKNKSGLSFR